MVKFPPFHHNTRLIFRDEKMASHNSKEKMATCAVRVSGDWLTRESKEKKIQALLGHELCRWLEKEDDATCNKVAEYIERRDCAKVSKRAWNY